MKNSLLKHSVCALLFGAACLSVHKATYAGEKKLSEIKNGFHEREANDLHITFSGKVDNVKLDKDPFGDGGTSKDGITWNWEHPQHWQVDPQGFAHLQYTSDDGVSIVLKESYWTYNDEEMIGALETTGSPPGLKVEFDPVSGDYFGFARFYNHESYPVLYSQIRLYKDNNLANYDDNWENPSGTLVKGPRRLVLNPGQSVELSLGVVQPGTYMLALTKAARAGQSDDKFAQAAAHPILN